MGNAPTWWSVVAVGVAVVAGCAKQSSEPDNTVQPTDQVPSEIGKPEKFPNLGRQIANLSNPCGAAEASGPLSWFSDDYDTALACARASNKPLVIDLWAPWCHTCLSMKHTVLIDPALAPLADRFVWLRIDTDKPGNAAVVTRLPPQAWPTFYIIAPDESVQARHSGAASVAQFRELLHQGEQGFIDITADKLPADSPIRLVRDGDRAMAEGRYEPARSAFTKALAKVELTWPRRPATLVSLVSAYYKAGDLRGCLALARTELANTGRSASAADFTLLAGRCASRIAEAAPDDPDVRKFRQAAAKRLLAVINDAKAPLSADDRGDAMRILRELRLALGDERGAKQIAARQRAWLDKAAEQAPTAFAAMTYHWPRMEVYQYLGVVRELIPALEKSIEALPTEYDPPYRLARVYQSLGEYDNALPPAEQALALAYGPRKAAMQRLIAELHAGRNDVKAERAARQAVIAIYQSLPDEQISESALEQAREALAALDDE